MKEHHYLLSWKTLTCNIPGHSDPMYVFRVEELLPNGKKQTVYLDTKFQSNNLTREMGLLFQALAIRTRSNQEQRGAA